MTARLIDGKAVAATIREAAASHVAEFERRIGRAPGLATVLVGEDPASAVYVRSKNRATAEAGMASFAHNLPDSTSEAELLQLVSDLNADERVDGILVQLPLPKQIDPKKVIDAIDPAKDVDGFHPINVGRLHMGRPTLTPCTPAGVIRLIDSTGESIEGKHAVVIGRSDIVGKPQAALLLQRNATVTICHSRTQDLPAITREADILVAAIGKARFVTRDMVKSGAVVIDVGMNRVDGKLAGDVDFDNVKEVASWITPVPGGVGPMTIIMLMRNTLTAAKWRRA